MHKRGKLSGFDQPLSSCCLLGWGNVRVHAGGQRHCLLRRNLQRRGRVLGLHAWQRDVQRRDTSNLQRQRTV